MADYKLKLEIDAAELQKQLETAFKKGIKGFSGGGSQGANTVAGQKYFKQEEKMKKQMNRLTLEEKKQLEKHTYTLKTEYAKQKTLLRAQNIMLEKSGVRQQRTFRMIGQLLGGGIGGAGGSGLDQLVTYMSTSMKNRKQVKSTQQAYDDMAQLPGSKMGPRPEQEPSIFNQMADIGDRIKDSPIGEFLGSTKKTFEDKVPGAKQAGGIAGKIGSKIPQAVKLAGVGASLAGGAGLAKMIIDSSPMLKSMLKILNVGIMLILRPIGDFIGFMLRPLLVEFVKKVAVPAYKKGAVLAKEWGSKMGKVLTDLFSNPGAFLHEAIVNPLIARLEIMGHDIWRNIQLIGNYLNPLASDEQKVAEWNRIMIEKYAGCSPTSDQAVMSKYKMYDFEGMRDTEIGKMVTEFQNLSEEELYKTSPGKLDSLPPMAGSLEYISGMMLEGNNETVKTNELLEEMPEKIAAAQVEAAKQQAQQKEAELEKAINESKEKWPEWFGDKYAQTKRDSDFEKARLDEERRLAEEEEKRNTTPEEFFKPKEPDAHLIPKGGLSAEAQKAIAAYEAWKKGEAWAGGAAQAGGRFGAVDPLDTDKMGGMAGTGVFQKYDPEDGSTCMASREIFEYENFAADSRAQMDAYSKAIEESSKTGNTIKEEYNKIMEQTVAASAQAKIATQNHKLIKESTWEAKTNVQLMTDATKNMSDNLNATAKYVANLLRRGYSIRKESGARRYPQLGPMASGLGNAFAGSNSTSESIREKYRITLGNGKSMEQVLDPTSYKYFMNLRNTGKMFRGSPILSIQKMAAGGLITEPIFGIGQNTGKGYLMGEAGPERVTPGTGPANGTSGGNTFNITINATGIGDIERQLKPAILRMLKESTSRAGIV